MFEYFPNTFFRDKKPEYVICLYPPGFKSNISN